MVYENKWLRRGSLIIIVLFISMFLVSCTAIGGWRSLVPVAVAILSVISFHLACSKAKSKPVFNPTVSLSGGSLIQENGGVGTITASLSNPAIHDVTVNLAFSGTAVEIIDYTSSGDTIIIPAGLSTGDVTITAVENGLVEPNKTVIIDIDTVINGTEGGTQQQVVTIIDNDAPPVVSLSGGGSIAENGGVGTITATLSYPAINDVTVNLAFSGTAVETTNYTRSGAVILIPAGNTTGAVTITAVDNADQEPDKTVIVDITAVINGTEGGKQQQTVTIIDDDSPPAVTLTGGGAIMETGGVGTITATLSHAAVQDVTVNLVFSGTAVDIVDYTSSGNIILIPAGSTTGSVTITAVDNANAEPNKTVIVDIAAVINGTESGAQHQIVTIIDDEAPVPSVTLSGGGSIAENGGVGTITATLSHPVVNDVTVNLAFSGTAMDAADYTKSNDSIIILAGNTTGSMTITAIDNAVDEPNKNIKVNIDTVINGTESGAQQQTVTIINDEGWVQDAYLKASNSAASSNLGGFVAMSGDFIVVGAPREKGDSNTIDNTDGSANSYYYYYENGAAYVFKKDVSGDWIQDAYLKASNNDGYDNIKFGGSVAISGDVIVVGAPNEEGNSNTIDNADGSTNSYYNYYNSGAAYVFKKDVSGDWIQDAYLKASNNDNYYYDHASNFGNSVAISGDVIVVGASSEKGDSNTVDNTDGSTNSYYYYGNHGAAYVFKKDISGDWIQDAYLKASNNNRYNYFEMSFGNSVAISGDFIVVGARSENSDATGVNNTDGSASSNYYYYDSGAAYVFKKDVSGDWIQDAYLKASNSNSNACFGGSVAISGDVIVVGAPDESDSSTIVNSDNSTASYYSGAAYVFKKDGSGNWIQDAYLKASNAATYSYFGNSVAVSGDVIIVGADGESSNATTIDNTDGSASADKNAYYSGAAYVFKKDSSGRWFQDAYLKASNSFDYMHFGNSVAISGGVVVVGAYNENSNANSITNTDGSASFDTSSSESGAAYVFKVK